MICEDYRLRVVYDGSKPIGSRVLNVTIRCIDCDVPRYLPLVQDQYYKVVSQDFIGNGGGGYTMISNNRQNVEVIGVDYDVVMNYMNRQAPILKDLDGRIQITDACMSN
ncbi:unnamed protein product [Euphydryas editha]|uniref:5'-nucleotidase n=1 Tax=Euphydryas editha TaxID=104508 RepID=A0AAU9UC55_EUPED|nr:unnamed protein product [Euphydryas editha]